MVSRRSLAAVIWIVIATAAIQLYPATALAHGGHNHASYTTSSDTHDPGMGSAAQTNVEHAGAFAEVAGAGANNGGPTPRGTCYGGCCASGFSCCVPAILSEPALGLPTRLSGLEVLRPETSMRAGIDPETLPKPPKAFA